jgi:N6-adenosine-specific RNA methylase IME4
MTDLRIDTEALSVKDIQVNKRKRKLNVDKVAGLAESFELLGQLEPITITSKNGQYVLLAGWHRLEAAKLLGWEKIRAQLFEGDELECELVEIDENLTNNDLTVLEQGEQLERRNEILEAMGNRWQNGQNQHTAGGGEMVSLPKTTEDIAKESGLSKRSAQQRTQIARDIVPEVKELIRDTPVADSTTQLLELARLKPDEQIEVANLLDGETTVSEAKRKINREKRVEEILVKTAEPVEDVAEEIGKFPVIYADPPWQYDFSRSDSRKIENQYPTMSIEDICDMDVECIANDDCVLFLWATSPKLVEALQVIKSWGFEYKTNMVWVKDKIGMGYYARQKHELLLIATKGAVPAPEPASRPESVVVSSRGQHSKKPDEVYEIIEKMYPEYRKLEMFARSKREGWESWGCEV